MTFICIFIYSKAFWIDFFAGNILDRLEWSNFCFTYRVKLAVWFVIMFNYSPPGSTSFVIYTSFVKCLILINCTYKYFYTQNDEDWSQLANINKHCMHGCNCLSINETLHCFSTIHYIEFKLFVSLFVPVIKYKGRKWKKEEIIWHFKYNKRMTIFYY